jgi:putative ABC transport system permease protein
MIKNYFKIAWRSLLKHKLYTSIKIGGFAIGIAACLLIGLLVKNEFSYDKSYSREGSVFRLVGSTEQNGKVMKGVAFPAPLAKVMKHDFPDVENAGRIMPSSLFYGAGSNQLRRVDQIENSYEEGFCFADQAVLDILNIPMVHGDRQHALTEPMSVVISKSKSEKYFPGTNPIGKLMYINDDAKRPLKVGAVMEDFPSTSHIKYDFLISLAGKSFWEGEQDNWGASNYTVYIQTKPNIDVNQFEKKLTSDVLKNYFVPTLIKEGVSKTDIDKIVSSAHILLQRVTDIHLRSYDIQQDWQARGDIRFVWMFVIIAVFILLIACINFLNLSTAKSANRAKEVGLRKVIGSQRGALIAQFLIESILYSFLSFLVALVLIVAVLPFFNQAADRVLTVPWLEWWFIPSLSIMSIVVGVIAGLYPSFYLSAFKPIQVLKGNISSGSKNSFLRSTLVVFQFTASIILIIGTLIIYRQMNYISKTKIGFDKEQIVMIQGTSTLEKSTQTFKNELLKLSQVKSVSISDYLPVDGTTRNGNTFWQEGKQSESLGAVGQNWVVDEDYLNTLGMKLVSGRNFSKEMASDSQAVIINQAMAKEIGYKDPIGQLITNGWMHYTVIGIVQDFNYETMKQQVKPLILRYGESNGIISVKIKSDDTKQAIASIQNTWKSFKPHQPIRYSFLDENFSKMYADVERVSYLFTGFSILAIIVACLGLFALAAFMSEQRSKEMSIRKVLGASVSVLFSLLTKNFLKLIFISLLIATPIAWYLMRLWLQEFAYCVSISWDVFFIAGIIVLLIALATICSQAIKSAIANPIKSLRTE